MNKKMLKEIIEWIICIIIAICLAIFIRNYIVTPTTVMMSSMFPTLKENDKLLLDRLSIKLNKTLNRGDIITFIAPSNAKTGATSEKAEYNYEPKNVLEKIIYDVFEIGKVNYIKRVIAFPGEHVVIKDGKIYINGKILEEEYLEEDIITEKKNEYLCDFIVPDGFIFAIGDNRNNSVDCRDFGCIPLNKIEGKVLFRLWPLKKVGIIH